VKPRVQWAKSRAQRAITDMNKRKEKPDDESVWEMVERFYLRSTDQLPVDWALPEKPPSSPWLAVTLVGIAQAPQVTTWLDDFDRCMVWLIIDSFF
jgi:hypothetical protein